MIKANNEYKKTTSGERCVSGYLKTRYFMMFHAERSSLLRGESEHICTILKKHFDGLSESHQRHLVELYLKQNPNK